MLDVAMLARRMRQHGGQVRVRGAQPQILKLIEVVGLDRQPGVLVESHAAA